MGQHSSREANKANQNGRRRRSTTTLPVFVTGSPSNVEEKYNINVKPLGRGHYGVVRKCVSIETGETLALKTIRKARVSRLATLNREIKILQTVNHPNIIHLVDVFEDEKNLHLVTELCEGGELFDRIIEKTESEEGHYSERDAALLVCKILSAIAYCHDEHNISHRDLKPENFLFKSTAPDSDLKIIDFGLSRFEEKDINMTTRVGTPYYIAPEVLGRNYSKACDLWSIGVISYILLCGYPPFYGENDKAIFDSVRAGAFDFPSPEWDSISEGAKGFITDLLQIDPSKRPTASEALKHSWLQCGAAAASENPIYLSQTLRRFTAMGHLKRTALNVIANQLTEADIGHLRQVFQKIDVDGNGVITIDELTEVVKSEGLEYIEDEIVALMKGIDIDENDSIEWQEFLAATMDRNIFIREDNVRRAFQYFDLGGTGSITAANLVKIFGSEDHAREIVGGIDLDGDGEISFSEFQKMMETDHVVHHTPGK